jgi:hypothetical protein
MKQIMSQRLRYDHDNMANINVMRYFAILGCKKMHKEAIMLPTKKQKKKEADNNNRLTK